MVYSESFAALPEQLKTRVLARLRDVLRGEDPKKRYDYLGAEERGAIYAVLMETLPGFAPAAGAGN